MFWNPWIIRNRNTFLFPDSAILLAIWAVSSDFNRFIFTSFFVVLGFELRPSASSSRCSTAWAMPAALFVLVIAEIRSHFSPGLAWTTVLLFMLPAVGRMTDRPPRPAISWYGVLWTFCQGWPETSILQNRSSPPCLSIGWDEISQNFTWAGLELWSFCSQPLE
jgi:hypothetical protein